MTPIRGGVRWAYRPWLTRCGTCLRTRAQDRVHHLRRRQVARGGRERPLQHPREHRDSPPHPQTRSRNYSVASQQCPTVHAHPGARPAVGARLRQPKNLVGTRGPGHRRGASSPYAVRAGRGTGEEDPSMQFAIEDESCRPPAQGAEGVYVLGLAGDVRQTYFANPDGARQVNVAPASRASRCERDGPQDGSRST